MIREWGLISPRYRFDCVANLPNLAWLYSTRRSYSTTSNCHWSLPVMNSMRPPFARRRVGWHFWRPLLQHQCLVIVMQPMRPIFVEHRSRSIHKRISMCYPNKRASVRKWTVRIFAVWMIWRAPHRYWSGNRLRVADTVARESFVMAAVALLLWSMYLVHAPLSKKSNCLNREIE